MICHITWPSSGACVRKRIRRINIVSMLPRELVLRHFQILRQQGRRGSGKRSLSPESGDHQPCVMPACAHTFTRTAVSKLIESARDSQRQVSDISEQSPRAVALVLSLLCIAAWPDGRIAGFLRVLLLCGCFYVGGRRRSV